MGLEHGQEKEKDRGVEVQFTKGKIKGKKHMGGLYVACITYCHVFQLGNRLTTMWAFLL